MSLETTHDATPVTNPAGEVVALIHTAQFFHAGWDGTGDVDEYVSRVGELGREALHKMGAWEFHRDRQAIQEHMRVGRGTDSPTSLLFVWGEPVTQDQYDALVAAGAKHIRRLYLRKRPA